ncbi:hypothetical protein ACLOJK_011938 [Asimina triloba]
MLQACSEQVNDSLYARVDWHIKPKKGKNDRSAGSASPAALLFNIRATVLFHVRRTCSRVGSGGGVLVDANKEWGRKTPKVCDGDEESERDRKAPSH